MHSQAYTNTNTHIYICTHTYNERSLTVVIYMQPANDAASVAARLYLLKMWAAEARRRERGNEMVWQQQPRVIERWAGRQV